MPLRSLNTINQSLKRSKANEFYKMMVYADNLTIGVSSLPYLVEQSNLIFSLGSEYSTDLEKNIFADRLGGLGDDIIPPHGVFSYNLFNVGF